MPTTDPRVDAYIEKSAEFAKPILSHIRKLVHKACPDITETMKWSFPHFDHKGTICSMASFKQHCAFGFWKQSLMEKDAFPAQKTAMGSFGRIASLDDLPDDKVMIGLLNQAIELNEKGVKVAKKPVERKELVVPDDMAEALKKDKKAKTVFDAFSYSNQKEYVEWITEAKTEATRNKRLATTIEWLAEGKSRNWKYEKC
ncbi:MAG: YdeI/OmpD-associated family protein [Pyrinomonadaceae bacterium]